MNYFAIQLTKGFKPEDLQDEDYKNYEVLNKMGALEKVGDLWRLKSLFRAGELFVNGETGYLSSLFKEQKDLLIEAKHLAGAKDGDVVVVKRLIAKRGRPSAKVVHILKRARVEAIYISKKEGNNLVLVDIKTSLPSEFEKDKVGFKDYKEGTLFKVDLLQNEIVEVLGHIDDPKVDEEISLTLFKRSKEFPKEATLQAKNVPTFVSSQEIEGRVDLRELPFCTIDPVSAKDFDDAIYWDAKNNTLYVAIADVSHYVNYFSPIDKEAIKRGFTTYFPHKAIPMLPPILSENICSLKPNVDRLAFVAKLKIDTSSLEVKNAQFIEAVIHSKRRFNYEEIDAFLEGSYKAKDKNEETIFAWLKPLFELTQKFKAKRLKKGFDFRSQEIKVVLDENYLLQDTQIETGTPSHSLIEECMLLANKAAAKRFKGEGDAIFRVHDAPKEEKLQKLLQDLGTIGIFVEEEIDDVNKLIKTIQKEAKKANLESEVDELIIQSLKQASYSSYNIGHFGLGFDFYSHFTSPIRRYSDLILHRLIKAQLKDDKKEMEYLLRNIEALSARVSELERESTKCEWDFRDRKFARWAKENIGNEFLAKIIEVDVEDSNKGVTARLLEGAKGASIKLKAYKSSLFDTIKVKISEVDLLKPTIIAQEVANV